MSLKSDLISEAIDLVAIEQSMSSILGVQFDFESLDLTAIADSSRLGALSAAGHSDIGKFDQIVVGDYRFFRQEDSSDAIVNFDRMVFTVATLDSIDITNAEGGNAYISSSSLI